MPKLPPARPQSLDDLMAHGEFFADFHLRKDGHFPPTCFLLTKEGPVVFQPGPVTGAESKEQMVMLIKMLCVAHAATAVVTVMEAWASFATPEAPLDPNEPPSEAVGRREVVMVEAECREKVQQKCLAILRTGRGSYFGLGEDLAPPGSTMEGRFAQFLPPLPPTPKQQRWAAKQLKELGLQGRRP